MRIAVIGANGQLGSELMVACKTAGHEVIGYTHVDVEVATHAGVAAIRRDRPDCIINTAAMHDLLACEENPAQAWKVNVALPLILAARRIEAAYVYISTDYVFDGTRGVYDEDAACRPISAYGRTKRAGELAALVMLERVGVCRVSYLFGKTGCRGKGGGNFVDFVVDALREGEHLTLDDDTWFSPTYARDAALEVLRVAQRVAAGRECGVYHCANSGCCSHYQFATAIADIVGWQPHFAARIGNVDPLRPRKSALVSTRLPQMPRWTQAVRRYCKEKGYVT